MIQYRLSAMLLLLAVSTPAVAADVYVDPLGAGDYLTIQEALNAAIEGDTVRVTPGTYGGPLNVALDFGGKGIGLISEAGASQTVIDCQEQDRGFYFHSGEDQKTVVRGFTVTGGSAERGGAAYCRSSSPTFKWCTFSGNTAGNGAALWLLESSSVLTHCRLEGNVSTNYGGAIYCDNSSPTISNCVITGNDAATHGGGIYCRDMSRPAITECTFYMNSASDAGGGIRCYSFSSPTITGCTFSTNHATSGAHVGLSHASSPIVTATIAAFGADGGGISAEDGTCLPHFTRCCVFANAGGDSLPGFALDTISADPMFCDVTSGELGLASDSPCMPDNNQWGQLIGAHGEECDLSPVEGVLYATATEVGSVVLRWTVSSLAGITGFNVYRATSPDGPFLLVSDGILAAESPGEYEDTSVWAGTTFWYNLAAVLAGGEEDVVEGSPARVTTGGRIWIRLHPPSPNPLTREASIYYDVPDRPGSVKLAVYNVRGQMVKNLVYCPVGSGRHVAVWDGTDGSGSRASAGVYFIRLEVAGETAAQKILVTR